MMKNKLSSLSIIIPTYNESMSIIDTIEDISAKIFEYAEDYEIIISDDGSTDNTVNLVKNLNNKYIIINEHSNTGKGGAVKRGIDLASKDFLLFMDADNSATINELAKVIPYTNDYKIVVGSRAVQGDYDRYEYFYRKRMGLAFNWLVRKILKINIFDTQCGYKLFDTNSAKRIFTNLNEFGFVFDIEVLIIAKSLNLNVKEVGISWVRKKITRVNIFLDSYKMFVALFRIKNRWIDKVHKNIF